MGDTVTLADQYQSRTFRQWLRREPRVLQQFRVVGTDVGPSEVRLDTMKRPTALTHFRYLWLGLTNKWCLVLSFWAAYCIAPIAFDFPQAAAWWLLAPVAVSVLALVYFVGRFQAARPNG
jgi:hypothetical protein